MHKMPEFVEECDHFVVLHQAGVARVAAGEVAHQHTFRKLASADAGKDRRAGEPLVLAVAGMHVEINAAQQLALVVRRGVVDIEGVDGLVPHDGVFDGLEGEMEETRRGLEDAGLHLVIREIRTDALRVEVVFCAAVLLTPVG